MSIISLEDKRLCAKKAQDSEELPECCNKTFSKVVHISRFLRLKQTAHWENIKLRNGLVLKIHKARKTAEDLLKNLSSEEADIFRAKILEIASDCADEILYSEEGTTELLNKYWACKNAIDAKVKAFTKTFC